MQINEINEINERNQNYIEFKGKRAGIYARYSSTGQDPVSIEIQREACLKLAKKKNLYVVDEYF